MRSLRTIKVVMGLQRLRRIHILIRNNSELFSRNGKPEKASDDSEVWLWYTDEGERKTEVS